MSNEPYRLVKVSGQYYVRLAKGKDIAYFEAEFKVPMSVKNQDLMYVIRRKLLDKQLRIQYPKSAGHRTCFIDDIQLVRPGQSRPAEDRPLEEIPISEMSKDQLERFCLIKQIPVDINEFASIGEARQKVQDTLDNLEFLKKKDAEDAEKKAEEMRAQAELEEMNDLNKPLPPEETDTETNAALEDDEEEEIE